MAKHLIKAFASFPTAAWRESLASDLKNAEHVRVASGFTNRNGAREFLAMLNPATRVEFILGLGGCEGPDVVRELEKHPLIEVRGSLVTEFHWKFVSIASESARALYIGSANVTSKGLSGAGENVLRITGSLLDGHLWDTLQLDFDSYFEQGTTVSGVELISALERVEIAGDCARGAQADLQIALAEAVRDAALHSALNAERAWYILWRTTFTDAEEREINRAMGELSPGPWTRGEIEADLARHIRVGHVVLGYSRDETEFILGTVSRLQCVKFHRDQTRWISDLHEIAPHIDGQGHPREYAAIRTALAGALTRDGRIERQVYDGILKTLRDAGLLNRTTESGEGS